MQRIDHIKNVLLHFQTFPKMICQIHFDRRTSEDLNLCIEHGVATNSSCWNFHKIIKIEDKNVKDSNCFQPIRSFDLLDKRLANQKL